MTDIDLFREELQSLISKFEKDRNYYLSKGYPEAQVRIDFINPLFNALGWDIENKAQKPPHADNFYSETTSYIIPLESRYLLAILNSKLWTFIFSKISSQIRGGFYRWKRQYMFDLPIRTIDFNKPSEKAIHDKLVSLVDKMLDLHKKKSSLPPSAQREKIEREIAITDEKIDELVYKLYGITDEERKIIEGG